MEKQAKEFLFKLLDTKSPSGNETEFQKIWCENVKKFAEVETDHTGSAVAVINPKAKMKVLLAGHCDEISMMVSSIEESGYINFVTAGGVRPELLPGLRVDVLGYKGKLTGVIGFSRTWIGDVKCAPKTTDFFIDVGIGSKKEVEKYVRTGDYIIYQSTPEMINDDKLVCKALDNKTGAFIVAEALRQLSKKKLNVAVYAASTTGEETNMRGAYSVASRIKPTFGIACDVTFNTDVPNEDMKTQAPVNLGGGPVLSFGSPINRPLNQLIEKAAVKGKIPFQLELTPRLTHTDADKIMYSGEGVPTALISLPLRYMHSPIEMASVKDIDAIVKLLVTLISGLSGKESLCPLA